MPAACSCFPLIVTIDTSLSFPGANCFHKNTHTKRDARLPVRPFESFDIGARTVNAAAWICSNCIMLMKPFFIYAVSALFIMTAESGAPGLPVEKETVPANDRYRNKSYAISLRWHYPNQVPGLDDTVHSQPAANQLPFSFSFSIVKLSGICVKTEGDRNKRTVP